jgi:hypothetical protein
MKENVNHFTEGDLFMWVITVHAKERIQMFEFDTEIEAREAFKKIEGSKFLSEVIYFNDSQFALSPV